MQVVEKGQYSGKRERNLFLHTGVTMLFVCFLFGATAQSPNDNIEAFLISQMKQRRIPGMQVAVVQHGKIVMLKALGYANMEDSVLVTNHTVFPIHSITKAFTGVAAMQLVEAGKLDLDAPVSRYLDSLPEAWREITVRQLMTHMSGIPDIIDRTARMIDNDDSIAWAKVCAIPVLFAPGEKFKYAMTNYILIGKIIDKLTREPFTKFMADRQFNVVDMPNTNFSDSRDVIPHLSESYWYRRNAHGKRIMTNDLQIYFRDWPPIIRAAAGINTTAEELAKWSIAVQQGRLINKQSLATMWSPGTLNDGTHQSFSTLVNGYGLGWPVAIRPEHRAYGPTGGGCVSMFIYPDDDLTVVLLTNLTFSDPESFIDEVASYYIKDMHAYNGFGFGTAVRKLQKELVKLGFKHASEAAFSLKKDDSNFHLEEGDVNGWAYALLNQGDNISALEIFHLDTVLYPESWNVYDSYADALLHTGRKNEAIDMYKKSIELNPKNENGKRVLDELLKK